MPRTTKGLDVKDLKKPDEVRRFDKGRVEVFELGGTTVGRATFEPGWKWSDCVKPLAGTESCRSAHVGYQLSGRMHVVMDDGGEAELGAGDLFFLQPGHDAWVVGDEDVVVIDFQGMKDYAKEGGSGARSARKH